jgi:glycosyltransferase involved in cell wall biosynthesis
MLEASSRIAEALDPEIARLLSFPVERDAIEQLAERLLAWLALDPERRREVGRQLAHRVDELWSWDRVAEGVIAASAGRLDELPAP